MILLKVNNIPTITDAMEKSDMCDMYKNMLSEVDKLLRIDFCFPVIT